VIERNARNPRRIKRFINGFVLEFGLDEDWRRLGAVSLIRVLILQIYFPEFMRLFNERAPQDPISEFMEYVEARRALRRRVPESDTTSWEAIRKAYDSHGLGLTLIEGGDYGGALGALEAEMPEGFPKLAQDQDFVSLLESFGTPEHWEQVRLKLERRPLSLGVTLAAESASAAVGATPEPTADQAVLGRELPPLAGLRVLWLDDHPENNYALSEELRQAGADVAIATDFEEAERQLIPPGQVDFLISDITRGQEANAGFTDLRRLRDAGLYDGPAAFFTARITPTRRRMAAELGALDVTDSWARVLELLVQQWVKAMDRRAEAAGRAMNA
jgi:CheY-like chemotaxis protein